MGKPDYVVPAMADMNRAFNYAWKQFPGCRLEREDTRAEYLVQVCQRQSGRGTPYDARRGTVGAWLFAVARSTILHALAKANTIKRGHTFYGLETDAALMDQVDDTRCSALDIIVAKQEHYALTVESTVFGLW